MNIGVIDVISHKIDNSFHAQILNPCKSSIGAQSVAAWLEDLGHKVWYFTFTGREDLRTELNQDIDIVFISSYTHCAYVAIAISSFYKRLGITTVLGGPHARGFSKESVYFFDYVIGLCDKELLKDLLVSPERHYPGVFLTASKQPDEFPSIKQRWKYIKYNHNKIPSWTKFPIIIPGITSTGCPFACDFCIDSSIPYKSLELSQLESDIRFVNDEIRRSNNTAGILFYDPNLGVGLKKRIEAIERNIKPGLVFFGEMNLTTLVEDVVKKLKSIGFYAAAPGIESWSNYDKKTILDNCQTKMDKVYRAAESVNMICDYLPLVQANLIFGLDCDSGEEPFILTREFIKNAPRAITNFQTLTAFGSSPLCKQMEKENRILNIPYFLIDGFSSSNIKISCNLSNFYKYYSELVKYSMSVSIFFKKAIASKKYQLIIFHALRQFTKGRGSYNYYKELSRQMNTDEFASFYSGESRIPPKEYHTLLMNQLGSLYFILPRKVVDYFVRGIPYGQS